MARSVPRQQGFDFGAAGGAEAPEAGAFDGGGGIGEDDGSPDGLTFGKGKGEGAVKDVAGSQAERVRKSSIDFNRIGVRSFILTGAPPLLCTARRHG